MLIKYGAHVSEWAWLPEVEDGKIAGTVGGNRALEAFKISELNLPNSNINAKAHVQDVGWMEFGNVGSVIGTTGQAKHVEAVIIGLTGDAYNTHDIWYRCHVQDYGWLEWSCNGGVNGTTGGNKQVEAIQIEIHDKNEGFSPRVDTDIEFIDLTPQAPPTPPRDPRADLIAIAASHLGYAPGTSADSAFGRRIDGPNAGDWCCYFVVCCCLDAGLAVPVTGYCPYMLDWAQQNGRFTGNPEPGFLVLYDFNGNGVPDHIGIIEQVYASDHVLAIEGNTGDPIGVYRKDRDWGILGYVNPF